MLPTRTLRGVGARMASSASEPLRTHARTHLAPVEAAPRKAFFKLDVGNNAPQESGAVFGAPRGQEDVHVRDAGPH